MVFLLRIAIIALVLYVAFRLVLGGYSEIRDAYWWMRP